MKLIKVLTCVGLFLISCRGFAMESFDCQIDFSFSLSETSSYSYTGFGDLYCADSKMPSTIYASLTVENFNPEEALVPTFKLTIKNFEISPLSSLFQNYIVSTNDYTPTLYFPGNDDFSAKTLNGNIESFGSLEHYQEFLDSLKNSELRIEQDDFFTFLD